MVDFINEVDESVRAQEMRDSVRKVLPWIIGVVAVIILATAGWFGYQAWRTNAAATASAHYNRGIQALQGANPDRVAADAAFTAAAEVNGAPAYKALALMQRAGMAVQDGRTADAVKLFDESAKAAPDPIIADAAALKAAYLLVDTATFEEIQTRLTPLAQEGRPYRPLAREALALALLNAGRTAEARTEFVAISLDLKSPQGLQARAKAAIETIDSGVSKRLPAIAKAAIAQSRSPASPSAPFVTPAAPAAAAPAGAAPQ